jgi:hypothetical protein
MTPTNHVGTRCPATQPVRRSSPLECPRIVYTNLDTSLCKASEETLLMGVEPSSRTL